VRERAELMIGEFARRSRLPISTLRYYDKIGLLAPALVDPDSGYRRYSIEQLPAAMLIHRLRSLGLAPAGIARVLADGPAALLRERRRIADEVESGRERLRRLDELLAERLPDDHRVEVVTLRPREVAARAFSLPAAELEPGVTRAIAGLRSALRRAGHRRTGPWGATFPVDPADQVSGFVFAPVDTDDPAGVDTARLPASTAVATVHRGGPASLPLAYHAAFAVLDRLGAAPAGPVLEEYPTLEGAAGAPQSVCVWVPFALPSVRA
jgi:DNA-binding transcriptional MerR regulator